MRNIFHPNPTLIQGLLLCLAACGGSSSSEGITPAASDTPASTATVPGSTGTGAASSTAPAATNTTPDTTATVANNPSGFSTMLAVNGQESCAVDAKGSSIYCWGSGNSIRKNRPDLAAQDSYPTPVKLDLGEIPAGSTITQLVLDNSGNCALTSTGAAYCWGTDNFPSKYAALLGTGLPAGSTATGTPRKVLQGKLPAGVTFKQLSIFTSIWGKNSFCGAASDGWVYCWGSPGQPVMGNSEYSAPFRYATEKWYEDQTKPMPIDRIDFPTDQSAVNFALGYNNACLLSSAGKMHCNGVSFKALDQTFEIPSTVKLVKLSNSSGGDFWSALGDDGWVYSYGYDGGSFARFGVQEVPNVGYWLSSITQKLSPGAIPAGTKLLDVTVGGSMSCAVGSDGRGYCWGVSDKGGLGNGNSGQPASTTPVQVAQGAIPSGVSLSTIRCGNEHCIAIGSDKRAYGWGLNKNAALGNLSPSVFTSPQLVATVPAL